MIATLLLSLTCLLFSLSLLPGRFVFFFAPEQSLAAAVKEQALLQRQGMEGKVEQPEEEGECLTCSA